MMAASLSLASWYFHISRIADRLGMTWVGVSWTSVERAWKPVLNCQNLATWFLYIAIWWINSKIPKGSMITRENSSVARESSRVITLKSLYLHERGLWHFWSSDLCTQWLMTAVVLARSPTLRPPQFNDGARP